VWEIPLVVGLAGAQEIALNGERRFISMPVQPLDTFYPAGIAEVHPP
jgi:hypothetical protein